MNTRLIFASLMFSTTALFASCTAAADPPAVPEQPAQAGKFPDLSSYKSVNPDDYRWESDNPGRPTKITTYGFSTPDGIGCTFGQSSATCTGNNLPAITPARCDPAQGIYGENEISTDTGLRKVSDTGCSSSALSKQLPAFHTIIVNGVTCGVDDKKMTACKDPQGRGFILSPAWSGWLPNLR